jgi:hypothetical protein
MTVSMLDAIREAQILLVAVMLLGGAVTKLTRAMRTPSVRGELGPTALFPLKLRRPTAMTLCAIEFVLGIGLLVTAVRWGSGPLVAPYVRVGTVLLFVIATSALIELRTVRPDVGCGCFGDFSTTPVSGRTIARSALLGAAALSTVGLKPIKLPTTAGVGLELLAILCAEFLVIGALSPEVGEALIRLGYSEPCELRHVPSSRTLAALHRSKQWRRYSTVRAADTPVDIWRELCWRYVVYPSSYAGRPADLVFTVYLQRRRPIVHATLVDASTGRLLPWPVPPSGGDSRPVADAPRGSLRVPAGMAVVPARPQADLPLSTDL